MNKIWPFIRMTLKGFAAFAALGFLVYILSIISPVILGVLFGLAVCVYIGALIEDE